MPGPLSCFFIAIRRQGGEPFVIDWATHREMVEALPFARRNAERLVDRIVEIAAHARRTNTCLFGLKVQHLSNQTRLPEQIPIESGAEGNQAVLKVGDHPQAEGAVPGYVLIAGDTRSESAAIPFLEQVKR